MRADARGVASPAPSGIEPGTRYVIPARIARALEQLFHDPELGAPDIDAVPVVYRPLFVRSHLALIGARYGSVTRPRRIYTNLAAEVFFAHDRHVLHEFYHVIEQWGRGNMTALGYLLRARQREREAEQFAEASLERYRELLRAVPPEQTS